MSETPSRSTPNALAQSASPYLQQHALNPVDWVPWSPEAFAEARRRDVPVIVSIGYSTCHWCHVMAHECFEDGPTAALMNAGFVNIKVDREEHPEVDEIYMDAVQALTGRGGWPLNAIVDHDGTPFFAGTYFPVAQWRSVLTQVRDVWRDDRPRIAATAKQLGDALRAAAAPRAGSLPDDLWEQLEAHVSHSWDPRNAGLGQAPKFPPSQLLGAWLARGDDASLAFAEPLLQAMQDGGLHDRVGGGFHRYSVDAVWRVPHFEKMLYDNVQLMAAYADAGARLGRPDFRQTAINTGDYLLRDLRVSDAAGAFLGYASAEDADDPGGEGSFYAWSPQSVREVLPGAVGEPLIAAWDLAPGERHRGRSGHLEPVARHIPHPRAVDLAGLAPDGDVQALRASWEPLLPRLREVRASRQRPGRDDKVLTDLNGLALAGLAALGRWTGEARFVDATRELAEALADRHGPDGLTRMPGRPAFVTDYGHLSMGLLEAFDLLGDPALVARAVAVADEAVERLRAADGSFFTTPSGRADLIRRSREHHDGPYPAGVHALAVAFVRLGALTGEARWGGLVDGIIAAQGGMLTRAPTACPTLLRAACLAQRGAETAVVAGPSDDPRTHALLAAARRSTRGGLLIVPAERCAATGWPVLEGRLGMEVPALFVCVGDACLLPAHSADEAAERLGSLG